MRIGDRVYVHGYVDEIRNDTIIIRNSGGYFGTASKEVIVSSEDIVSAVRCKDCKHHDHCHETVAHTKEHDGFREHWSEPIEWCSRGERKGGGDE